MPAACSRSPPRVLPPRLLNYDASPATYRRTGAGRGDKSRTLPHTPASQTAGAPSSASLHYPVAAPENRLLHRRPMAGCDCHADEIAVVIAGAVDTNRTVFSKNNHGA